MRFARAQLTLVEHALCPLDRSLSLTPGSVHEAAYPYTDRNRNRRNARVQIGALEGLSAWDELYLWGLLAIALSQPDPKPDLLATPYYCLRNLRMVSPANSGGRQFESFRDALKRLAGIRYQNDALYDPVRGEHRAVSFGFLNYSLPLDQQSSRTWRFAWDPIFFELAQATGGALSFDLALYRRLDPASRRLYLFLKKIFWRRQSTGRLDLHHLAIDVLGFSATVETSHLKRKLLRCVQQLLDFNLLRLPPGAAKPKELFTKTAKGAYSLQLYRGEAFASSFAATFELPSIDSPLEEPLRSIGFDNPTIHKIIHQYPATLVEQWADITLAAIERHGTEFFTRSPQAYFVDNVKAAADQRRTPPDWWRELRKQELQQEREQDRRRWSVSAEKEATAAFDKYLRTEARETFERITLRLIADLRNAGQPEPQARDNAAHMARMHLWNRYRQEHPEIGRSGGFQHIGSCL